MTSRSVLAIAALLCSSVTLAQGAVGAGAGSSAAASSSSSKPGASAPTVAPVKTPGAPPPLATRDRECAAQADARKLAGEARQQFVAACLKGS